MGGGADRLRDHMAAPRVSKSLQTDSSHAAAELRVPCARTDKCLRTLRRSPNKAGRLTGHVASNEKSGGENDRGRRGRKDLAFNGALRWWPGLLQHSASGNCHNCRDSGYGCNAPREAEGRRRWRGGEEEGGRGRSGQSGRRDLEPTVPR